MLSNSIFPTIVEWGSKTSSVAEVCVFHHAAAAMFYTACRSGLWRGARPGQQLELQSIRRFRRHGGRGRRMRHAGRGIGNALRHGYAGRCRRHRTGRARRSVTHGPARTAQTAGAARTRACRRGRARGVRCAMPPGLQPAVMHLRAPLFLTVVVPQVIVLGIGMVAAAPSGTAGFAGGVAAAPSAVAAMIIRAARLGGGSQHQRGGPHNQTGLHRIALPLR